MMKPFSPRGKALALLDVYARLPLIRRGTMILLFSGFLGLSVNALSPRGLPIRGPVPILEADGIGRIGLPEARELHRAAKGFFVDARSGEDYRSGHIPGAILLDQDSFDTSISAFQELVPLDTPVVAYCSGQGCGSSSEVAVLLREAGYQDIRVFPGGWEEWRQAGYPMEGRRPEEHGAAQAQEPAGTLDPVR